MKPIVKALHEEWALIGSVSKYPEGNSALKDRVTKVINEVVSC